MAKDNNIKDLSRKELVDMVCNIMDSEDAAETELVSEFNRERSRLKHKESVRKTILSTLGVLVVVAAVAVLLSVLLFPVIQVSGDSMEPSLHDGDILLLVKTENYKEGKLCCISWQNKLLIKRVIAKAGDTIDIDAEGNVSVNGVPLNEPYLTEKSLGECDITFPYQVPDGRIFVMGDKRSTSIDSRNSEVGSVGDDQIIGQVLFKVWPLK